MNINEKAMLTVVSHSFPPRVSAAALVLTNLLSGFSGRATAIAGYNRSATFDPTFSPPCQTEYLPLPSRFSYFYEQIRKKHPALAARCIRNSIRKSLRRFSTQIVLGVFPFDDMFVAGFQAAKDLNLPFYAYMQDLWSETMPKGSNRWKFANKWEETILSEAKRVICMTEAAQEYYEKKYGVVTYLLPHVIQAEDLRRAPSGPVSPKMKKPTVLFVGGINQKFNVDALVTLARASEFLPPEYELVYSTPVNSSRLYRLGIHSSRLKIQYVPRAQVQQFLSEAHVLIAPLSHKNCAIEEVQTLFSTKLLQYFLSGRPIVVFAPEDSFHVKSASKSGWGCIVSKDSPEVLAEAIVKVVEDKQLANNLVGAALKEAHRRHAHNYATRLSSWISEDLNPSAAVPVG